MGGEGIKRAMMIQVYLVAMSTMSSACRSMRQVQGSHPEEDGNKNDRRDKKKQSVSTSHLPPLLTEVVYKR